MATHQSKGLGSKDFFREDKQFQAYGSTLFKDEVERLQFKSPISKKADPHPEILVQPNLQDIDCLCHTISIIMMSGFEKTPIKDFMPI